MEHLLEKQLAVALLCLSMAMTISASRKEDLERAAELAVERAAEKAAERAVEKALEAGNKTSTTITVKESYSNARKTAEEQAAPGSESTRHQSKKTAVFESKDITEPPDYESNWKGSDYTDYNDTKSYDDGDDDDSEGYGDYKESRGYGDYNDSRGYGDYNESTGYSDYNDSMGFEKDNREYKESRSLRDDDSKDYTNHNDTKDDKNNKSSRSYRNYKDSRGYRDSDKSKASQEYDSKDYDDSKGYEVEDDYSLLNDTDYKKLNTSKSSADSDISGMFGDFEWSPNDTDFRHEFGSKLTSVEAKLDDSSEEDLSFYSTENDFLKKRDSKKEEENEKVEDKDGDKDDDKDDDSWKSHSDWQKDFKSLSDGSFARGSFWDEDESLLKTSKTFWTDDEDILSGDSKEVEELEEEKEKGSSNKKSSKSTSDEKSSTDKSDSESSSNEDDFSSIKSWPSDDDDNDDDDKMKKSKSKSKSYSRRSSNADNFHSGTSPFRSRLSRDNSQKEDTVNSTTNRITTSTTKPRTTEATTDRSFKGSKNKPEEGSDKRCREEYKDKTKERSKVQYEERVPEKTTGRNVSKKIESEEEKKASTSAPYRVDKNEWNGYKILPLTEHKRVLENVRKVKSRLPSVENKEPIKYQNMMSREQVKVSANARRPEFPFYNIEENVPYEKETKVSDVRRLEHRFYKTNKNIPFKEQKTVSDYIKMSESRPHRAEKVNPVQMYVTAPVPIPKISSGAIHSPYEIETPPPFWIDKEILEDIKIEKKSQGRVPVNIPITVNPLQRNLQGNVEQRSMVQFPSDVPNSINVPTVYPFIPSTTLTAPKPIFKDMIHHHPIEIKKIYSAQRKLPMQKHQQLVTESEPLVFVKMALPGPFPGDFHSPSANLLPANIHVDKPYTIHLDKTISMALEKRMPFIIHLPFKPKENQEWSEKRFPNQFENVPAESRHWIKRIRWVRT